MRLFSLGISMVLLHSLTVVCCQQKSNPEQEHEQEHEQEPELEEQRNTKYFPINELPLNLKMINSDYLSGRLIFHNPLNLLKPSLTFSPATTGLPKFPLKTLATTLASQKILAVLNHFDRKGDKEQAIRDFLACYETNFDSLMDKCKPTSSTDEDTTVTPTQFPSKFVVINSCDEANSACASEGFTSVSITTLEEFNMLNTGSVQVFAGATSDPSDSGTGLLFTFLDGSTIETNVDDPRWIADDNTEANTCLLWNSAGTGLENIDPSLSGDDVIIVPCQ